MLNRNSIDKELFDTTTWDKDCLINYAKAHFLQDRRITGLKDLLVTQVLKKFFNNEKYRLLYYLNDRRKITSLPYLLRNDVTQFLLNVNHGETHRLTWLEQRTYMESCPILPLECFWFKSFYLFDGSVDVIIDNIGNDSNSLSACNLAIEPLPDNNRSPNHLLSEQGVLLYFLNLQEEPSIHKALNPTEIIYFSDEEGNDTALLVFDRKHIKEGGKTRAIDLRDLSLSDIDKEYLRPDTDRAYWFERGEISSDGFYSILPKRIPMWDTHFGEEGAIFRCQKEGFKRIILSHVLKLKEDFVSGSKEELPYLTFDANIFSSHHVYTASDGTPSKDADGKPWKVLSETAIVIDTNSIKPYLFRNFAGSVYVHQDAFVYTIDETTINPEYLLKELYTRECEEQYFQDIRFRNPFALLNAEILIPIGCVTEEEARRESLYIQQQMCQEEMTEIITKIANRRRFNTESIEQLPSLYWLRGGKIQIKNFEGGGGFGNIYQAERYYAENTTIVALKELYDRNYCSRDNFNHSVLSTSGFEEQKERFRREFEVMSKLYKLTKYVPKIDDEIGVFEENGTLYYAMQYISGKSLTDYVGEKKSGLDTKSAIRIICQIGIVLHHAHAHDFLHLDVTPNNIMIDKEGQAVLLDFGNAKRYDRNLGQITTQTTVARTQYYAAPEQNFPDPGSSMYMQTDEYSLALSLFTALTNKVPSYRQTEYDNIYFGDIANELPQRNDINEDLLRVMKKALSYNYKDRYPTILDFLHAIPQELIDEEIQKEISALNPIEGFNAENYKADNNDGSGNVSRAY